MSQYFVKLNRKNVNDDCLSDPLSVSVNIVTFDSISCKIDDVPQIQGSITTTDVITANLQIPDAMPIDIYDGQYEIDPKAHAATILNTSGRMLLKDVTIRKIPYFETSNLSGYTVYIASEVN